MPSPELQTVIDMLREGRQAIDGIATFLAARHG